MPSTQNYSERGVDVPPAFERIVVVQEGAKIPSGFSLSQANQLIVKQGAEGMYDSLRSLQNRLTGLAPTRSVLLLLGPHSTLERSYALLRLFLDFLSSCAEAEIAILLPHSADGSLLGFSLLERFQATCRNSALSIRMLFLDGHDSVLPSHSS